MLAQDSLSAACKQNPAYCSVLAGKEAGSLPGRAIEAASAVKAWEELDTALQKSIEDILVACAKWADAEVNLREFEGRHPTQEECDRVVGGTRENPVTRCMRLGKAKHVLALRCTEEKLSRVLPGRFSLEQRYRLHPETRRLERISHEQELEMLGNGGKGLAGSVVPDVVIHTGDPLQVQFVRDFKFPCPHTNPSRWREYPPGNPLRAIHQGDAYYKTFGITPRIIRPRGAQP